MTMPARPLLALLLLAGAAWAADAPPAADWNRLRARLESGDPAAEAAVDGLCGTYPRWAEGARALAARRLAGGRAAEALAPARRAWQLGDPQAAPLLAQALVVQGRAQDALALAATPGQGDPGGWLSYWGAEAASDLGDPARGRALLAQARYHAAYPVPPAFTALAARLSLQAREWTAAIGELERAAREDRTSPAAWASLSRLRAALALQEPLRAAAHWEAGATAADNALRLRPGDAALTLDLARCLAGLAVAEGQARSGERWRRVETLLAPLAADPAAPGELHLLRGRALAALGEWSAAASELAAAHARQVPGSDPALLALALAHAGRGGEARPLLGGLATRPGLGREDLAGLALAAGADDTAGSLLAAAAEARAADNPTEAAALWYRAGHAWRTAAGDEAADRAAAAFAAAGDLGHQEARAWYAHLEGLRSPAHAYAAGQRLLAWGGQGGDGWRLVAAGYAGGAGATPVHRLLWLALVLIPLWFALRGRWRQDAVRQPGAGPEQAPRRVPQRTPPPAGVRTPPPASGGGAGKDETLAYQRPPNPAKSVTEEIPLPAARPRASAAPKAETEEVVLPRARPQPRGAALERGGAPRVRTPAPEPSPAEATLKPTTLAPGRRDDALERRGPQP